MQVTWHLRWETTSVSCCALTRTCKTCWQCCSASRVWVMASNYVHVRVFVYKLVHTLWFSRISLFVRYCVVHACVFVYIWVHTVWFSRTSLLFRARDVISELSESSFATTMSLYAHFVPPPNIFCVSCRWMLIDSISHEYRKALHIEWDVSCHDEKTQNVDTRLGMS